MNDRDNPNIFSFGVDKNFQNSENKIKEFDSNNGKYSFNNEENTEINPFENNVLTEIKKTNSNCSKNNQDEEIKKKLQMVENLSDLSIKSTSVNINNTDNINKNKSLIHSKNNSTNMNVNNNYQNNSNNRCFEVNNMSVIHNKNNNFNLNNNFSVINPNQLSKNVSNNVNLEQNSCNNMNIEVNHNNFQILKNNERSKDLSQDKNRNKSNSVSVEKVNNNENNQNNKNHVNINNVNNNMNNNQFSSNIPNISVNIGNNKFNQNQNNNISNNNINSQIPNQSNINNSGYNNQNQNNDNKKVLFNVLKQANEIYNKAMKHSAVFDYVQAISLFNESKELTKSVYNQLQSDEKTKQQMNNFIKAIDTQLMNNEMFRKNQFVYSSNNKNIKSTTDFSNDILKINNKKESESNKVKSTVVKDNGKDDGKLNKKNEKPEDNVNIPDDLKERILAEIVDSKPQIKFSDIIGLESAKQIIKEIIILPSIRPDLFTGLRSPPRGMLLFGPPGTGKTMLAKAVATECKCTFFNISASSLTSKYVGESEKLVRALFTLAFSKEPSVIFIDEIDSLLSKRGDNDNESSKRLKTEFLVQFDGVGSHPTAKVLIIGATNRPQELDVAVVRRLPKRVYVGAFDKEERKRFMKFIFSNSEINISDEEYEILALKTENYTNSDLKELCREAAYGPIREIEYDKLISTEKIRPIEFKDVINATKKVRGILNEEVLTSLKKWDEEFGALS